jgi:hypothetical protein
MKNLKLLSLTLSVTSVLLSGVVTRVTAESISITGNGAESASTVQANMSQTTNVAQTNTADVNNNTNVTSNTGNNSASGNNGDAAIQTGSTTTQVANNTAVNSNVAAGGCCPTESVTGSISGNGSNSTNGLNITQSNATNVTSTNNTTIINNIYGKANTGNNTANYNNGNVSITTGSIYVSEKVTNKFNTNTVEFGFGNDGGVDLSIKGNGSDSENTISYNKNNNVDIITTNIASIVNESDWDLNTGNNFADKNIGNVDLKTGDIVFQSVITNEGNINDVKVMCCKEEKPETPPTTTTPPTQNNNPKPDDKPTGNGKGGNGNGNGKGGDTLGAAIGKVLPATGLNLFVLALIGNIALLFLGMYLRLRSGRSPTVAFAI